MAKNSRKEQKAVHTSAPATKNYKMYWIGGLMAFLILIAQYTYKNALDNQFVSWDDTMYVTENPMFLQYGKPNMPDVWKTPIALNYHPLTMKSLLMNGQNLGKKAETDARPFISTNVWLHAFNCALVFLFLFLLTEGSWFVAFFGGLLFAVHPMHVESVAWVSERKDVLYSFFFLLASVAYLNFLKDRKTWWMIAVIGFFILSCLSKAMAVSLVPVLLLMDWHKGRSLKDLKVWTEKIPLFAIALLFGLIAMDIQKGGNFHGFFNNIEGIKAALASGDKLSLLNRFIFAAYGMMQYIFRFFAPFDLSPFYPYPVEEFQGLPLPAMYSAHLGLFILLCGLCAWSLKYTKSIFFGFAYYFFTVILVAQLISVGLVVMADRYTYLPYIGISAGLLIWIEKNTARKQNLKYASWVILSIFSVFCLTLTMKQVDVWQDTETLFSSARKLYPKDENILNNLGLHYGKTGKLEESRACFEEALSAPYPVRQATIYEGLGNYYGIKNNPQKAVEMFTKAIELNPLKGNFYYNRAMAYMSIDIPTAEKDLEKAMQLIPMNDRDKVYLLRGYCYLKQNQFPKVIDNAKAAIREGINTEFVHYQLALAYYNTGNREQAMIEVNESLRINPNFADGKTLKAQMGG
ncbi:MAG: tetratricopeptide repeat protein [Saprospiraceae bacterium]